MTTLDDVMAALARIEAKLTTRQASSSGDVADDADLDGQYGNPAVRRDPSAKYWTGTSYIGARLSDCPPDYLDAFAKHKDASAYMNEKSGDEAKAKYIEYDRRDARRARGWAKRIRDGHGLAAKPAASGRYGSSGGGSAKHSAPPEPSGADDFADAGDDSIPF